VLKLDLIARTIFTSTIGECRSIDLKICIPSLQAFSVEAPDQEVDEVVVVLVCVHPVTGKQRRSLTLLMVDSWSHVASDLP